MTDHSTQMVSSGGDRFEPGTYGSSFADVYDEWYPDLSDVVATGRFVDRFGGAQTILELGVGTGRLVGVLAGRGHAVFGVDASPEMLERISPDLNAVAVGADMAHLPFATGAFDTVIVATNTLFNLADSHQQHLCLQESRSALRFGGRLIVEAFVPPSPDPARDRLVTTRSIDIDHVVLTATIRNEEAQTITGQHIEITEAGIRLRPWRVRYAPPAELDEMARSAGFEASARYADWESSPFTDHSDRHVSVYVAV